MAALRPLLCAGGRGRSHDVPFISRCTRFAAEKSASAAAASPSLRQQKGTQPQCPLHQSLRPLRQGKVRFHGATSPSLRQRKGTQSRCPLHQPLHTLRWRKVRFRSRCVPFSAPVEGDAVTMSPSSAAAHASPGKSPLPRRYVPFSTPAEGDTVTMSPSSAAAHASLAKSPLPQPLRPLLCADGRGRSHNVPFISRCVRFAGEKSASPPRWKGTLRQCPLRRGDRRAGDEHAGRC
jgi:hypothetical protein